MQLVKIFWKNGRDASVKFYKSKYNVSQLHLSDIRNAHPCIFGSLLQMWDISNLNDRNNFKVLDRFPDMGVTETFIDGRTRRAKKLPYFDVTALYEFEKKSFQR